MSFIKFGSTSAIFTSNISSVPLSSPSGIPIMSILQLCFSLGNFYWQISKLTDSILGCVKSHEDIIRGILHSCNCYFRFWHFFGSLLRVSLSLLTSLIPSWILSTFPIRTLSTLIIVILNSHLNSYLSSNIGILFLILALSPLIGLFLSFGMSYNYLLKQDMLYWVTGIEVNRPLGWEFMLIWLEVGLGLTFAVAVAVKGSKFSLPVTDRGLPRELSLRGSMPCSSFSCNPLLLHWSLLVWC